jgi:hypothetical protein
MMSFKNLPKSYTLSIQIVHCVSLETLFDIITKRERYSTKTDNNNDNDNDSDIEIEDLGLMTTRQRVSLICPITQSLIAVPAKSSFCSHLTCFDLKAFLQMNERRLQWTCPLCKKSALFESLRIDERLQNILSNVPSNCSTVEIDSSTECQYILDSVKQEKIDLNLSTQLHGNNENESIANSSTTKTRHQSDESDCIVLSSGSESEEEDNDDDDDDVNPSSLPATFELDRQVNQIHDNTSSRSSRSSHSSPAPSPVISTGGDDGNYWEDIAQITYDLSSDASEKLSNRKRSNSSTTSILSSASSSPTTTTPQSTDNQHRRKRTKQTTDIEIITLTSSDSSDNNNNDDGDDQLS